MVSHDNPEVITCSGVLMLVEAKLEIFPNELKRFLPKVHKLPSFLKATPKAYPALTLVHDVAPTVTCVILLLLVAFAIPNCPNELAPTDHKVLSLFTPSINPLPAATLIHVPVPICTGLLRSATSFCPN